MSMWRSLMSILFAMGATSCGRGDVGVAEEAVLGGTADPEGYASQGSAVLFGFECSGTLIARDWVLTAAHCRTIPRDSIIRYWGPDRTRMAFSGAFRHGCRHLGAMRRCAGSPAPRRATERRCVALGVGAC